MKNKLTVLSVITLFFSAMSGAVGAPRTVDSLSIWHKEESPLSRQFVETKLHEFSERHKIKLDIVKIDSTDLTPMLLRNAHEGSLPDAALVPADLVAHHIELNLSPVPLKLQNKKVKPEFLDTARINNTFYSAPILGGNHLMLYYNKKYISKAPKTWEEIIAQAPSLLNKGVKPMGWFYSEPFWLVGFMPAFDGNFLTNGELTLNTPEIHRTLEFYKSLSLSKIIDPHCDYGCGAQQFFSGEVAYAINGDWAFQDGAKALGKDFGVSTLPTIAGKQMRPMYSTTGFIFPDKSLSDPTKKDLLLALIQFMQSEELQEEWFHEANRFPVHKTVFEKLKKSTSVNNQLALAQMEQSVLMPNHKLMAHIWQGLRKAIARYVHHDLNVEQVLESTERYILHNYNKSLESD